MEIVVASGKGGTGKTTVSSFLFSFLSSFKKKKVVGVDADVEAPDLLIALGKHRIIRREPIVDSKMAIINYDQCILCGDCVKVCQFGAIEWDSKPIIIEPLCEGCGACSIVCPPKAISLTDVKTGDLIFAETEYGPVITGELEIGKKHSGHLVEILKSEAKKLIYEHIIVDAAAGTGCSVISSIAGSDYLIIVVEPTPQAMRSAKKIFEIGKNFGVRMGIVVNKFDINPNFVDDIFDWAEENSVDILGRIPYDYNIVRAYANMKSLLEFAPESEAARSLSKIAEKLFSIIGR